MPAPGQGFALALLEEHRQAVHEIPQGLQLRQVVLTDAYGRPLDGNYDGQPGGNFVATFQNRGITFAQVKSAARIEALSASAVDVVFEAGLIPSVPPARGRL